MDDKAAEFRVYSYIENGDYFTPKGYPVAWQTIKHDVRDRDGHRCLRCKHPYLKGMGEWSACDGLCSHLGVVRYRQLHLEGNDWHQIDMSPHGIPFDLFETGPNMNRVQRYEAQAQWRILTVHHLNNIKADCRWWNLVSLCQRCHLTIQGKVKLDRPFIREHSEWFKPFAAGWYAHRYLNLDVTYDDAVKRMDELLDLEHLEREMF